jgi:hypothetical protein
MTNSSPSAGIACLGAVLVLLINAALTVALFWSGFTTDIYWLRLLCFIMGGLNVLAMVQQHIRSVVKASRG